MIRALVAMCLLGFAAAAAQAATAAEAVPVRAADHGGYARIVFDWPQPVGHSLKLNGHELSVTFDRPMDASFVALRKKLKNYVTAARLDNDARTAVFVLAGDYTAQEFENGNSVAVDIRAPGAPVAAKTAPPAAKPALKINVRTGIHPDFNRVVFDWPSDVAYTASESGGALTLDFKSRAEIVVGRVHGKLPPFVTGIEQRPSQDGTVVTIRAPDGARFKHFRSQTKVVVDVSVPESALAMLPADGPAPPKTPDSREKDAEPQPAAPAPKKQKAMFAEAAAPHPATVGAPVSLLPVQTKPLPQAPPAAAQSLTPDLSPAKGPPDAPPAAQKKTDSPATAVSAKASTPSAPDKKTEAPAQVTAKAEEPPVALVPPPAKTKKLPDYVKLAPDGAKPAAVAVTAKPGKDGLALNFAWDRPTPAAVFRRAGNLWVVFGREAALDVSALGEWHKEIAAAPAEIGGGTALRLAAGNGLSAHVTRDGNAVSVVLADHAEPPASSLVPTGGQDGLLIPVKDAGPVLTLRDPAVGDTITVVPVLGTAGMAGPREYALFRLPATAAGVVVEPLADGILARTGPDGVTITSPGNLYLSEANGGGPIETGAALPDGGVEIDIAAPHLFDFATWGRGDASFEDTRKYLQQAIIDSKGDARTNARRELARFCFARGFYADALGLLRVAATDDPRIANEAGFLALRGASLYLMGDYAGATADFNSPILIPNPEAQLWRGALAASQTLWPEAVRAFAQVGDRIPDYPLDLKVKFALLAAETAVQSNEFEAAGTYLKFVEDAHPGRAGMAEVKYLRGKLAETQRDYETATTLYGEAAAEGDAPTAVKAQFAGVNMLWGAKKIRAPEAIKALEELRFAWRGDSFEFDVLRLLGDLYLETGDYEKGLRTLKRAVTFFPDDPRSKQTAELMSATFLQLYADGEADKMSPLKALGLYDEFKELTPPGEAGDTMARKLVERLVAVDLLEQAAAVLEPQVTARLQGADKAKWGTRLAVIRLLDRKPDLALKALSESDVPDLPAEAVAERKRLQARALSDQGKAPEALAVLAGEEGRDADLLRTDILWRHSDWAGAAAVLARLTESLPESGAKLDDAQAVLVLKRAAALWLADNRDALADMRDRFTAAMTPTPYGNDFHVIAAAPMGAIDSVQAITERLSDIDAYADFAARLKSGKAAASDAAQGKPAKEVAANSK